MRFFKLYLLILVIGCGGEEGVGEWKIQPRAKLSIASNDLDLPASGFLNNSILTLKEIPLNYKYAIYQGDSTCSIESKRKDAGTIDSDAVNIGDIAFDSGLNEIFVWVEIVEEEETENNKALESGDTVCILAGSYYKANANLVVLPQEAALQIGWNLDFEVNIKESRLSINGGLESEIFYNSTIGNLDEGVLHNLVLKLFDDAGGMIQITGSGTPNIINKADGIIINRDNGANLKEKGFADFGAILVSDTSIGDKVGIYSDSECLDIIAADIVSNSLTSKFNLYFKIGLNTFYIKKIPKNSTSKSSCSDLIFYTRGEVNLNLTPFEAGLTADFNATDGILAEYSIRIESDPMMESVTSPILFSGIDDVSQNVALVAIDEDGFKSFNAKDETPLPLNPTVLVLEKEAGVSFLSNPGFADDAILHVSSFVPGEGIEIYSNDSCTGTSIIGNQNISADNIRFVIPLNIGVNNFYAKRIQGDAKSCSNLVSYTKSDLDLTGTSIEYAIELEWALTDQIEDVSYEIILDADPLTAITTIETNYILINLTETNHLITLEARDLDSFITTKMLSEAPSNFMNPLNLAITKMDQTPFISNPGFSSLGQINVTNFRDEDSLDLYQNNLCKGIALASISEAITTGYFDVTFKTGINNFYIKRTLSYDPTKTSCSEAISYHKSAFDSLKLVTTGSEIEATWANPTGMPGSHSYTISLDPLNLTYVKTGTYNKFGNLPYDKYTVTLKTTDEDGETAIISKSPDNVFIKVFEGGGYSRRARINPNNDPFINMIPGGRSNSFAALRSDGSIYTWGNQSGSMPPQLTGYITISGNLYNYAALHSDGKITTWGDNTYGGNSSPGWNDFISISASLTAFAALRRDGIIAAWGDPAGGGINPPVQHGFLEIVATDSAFTALHTDGTLHSWGDSNHTIGTPIYEPLTQTNNDFTAITATSRAFAAIRGGGGIDSGKIVAWGDPDYGGDNSLVSDIVFTAIARNSFAFASLTPNGILYAWGDPIRGGTAPSGTSRYISITGSSEGFVAKTTSGSLVAWGNTTGGSPPTSSGYNVFGSGYAFAALAANGGIWTWGDPSRGGDFGPVDLNFTTITGNLNAFAAIHQNGTIYSWGDVASGGIGLLSAAKFTKIMAAGNNSRRSITSETSSSYSTGLAFVAMRADNSLAIWGDPSVVSGSPKNPIDFKSVTLNGGAFAGIKNDGKIVTWGNVAHGGGVVVPSQNYTAIIASSSAFSAIVESNGRIYSWGNTLQTTGSPPGTGFVSIYSNDTAFAGLQYDGMITAWGDTSNGGTGSPSGAGYISIIGSSKAFTALNRNGQVYSWGDSSNIINRPLDAEFVSVSASGNAFAGLKVDGSIAAWGKNEDIVGVPTGMGFTSIISNFYAFSALKYDGTIHLFGASAYGGNNYPTPPEGSDYIKIFGNLGAFAALKSNGSIVSWGNVNYVGSGPPPIETGFISITANANVFAALKGDGSIITWGNPSYASIAVPSTAAVGIGP